MSGENEILDLANHSYEDASDNLTRSPPGQGCRQERWERESRQSQWELTNRSGSLSVGAGWKTFAGCLRISFLHQISCTGILRPWPLVFVKLSSICQGPGGQQWPHPCDGNAFEGCPCQGLLIGLPNHNDSNPINLTRAWAKRHTRLPVSSASPPMSLTCQQVSFELMTCRRGPCHMSWCHQTCYNPFHAPGVPLTFYIFLTHVKKCHHVFCQKAPKSSGR